MWRCYGYFLGIEDRFNFCQPDNLVQMRRRANYWLRRIVLPGFKVSRPSSSQYIHSFSFSLNPIDHFLLRNEAVLTRYLNNFHSILFELT